MPIAKEGSMPTGLDTESSLYLQEYSNSLIHWCSWGTQALQKSQKEHKPIFLSIGYSGSYWCEVMNLESFNDEAIIKLLNDHFIAIKVDKDERPDIDKYYKQVYRLMNGQDCASPVSIFLTEQLEPFYSAAYIAPEARGNVLGFKNLLEVIKRKYYNDKITIQQKAQEVLTHLNPKKQTLEATRLHIGIVKTITLHAKELFDNQYGGFVGEPKFLQASILDLLLDTYELTHDQELLLLVEQTLTNIYNADIHDSKEGGFYRYANQRDWQCPRKEKTIYDNAMMLSLFTRMYKLSNNEIYKNIALETAEFMLTHMYDRRLFYSNSVIKNSGEYLIDTKKTTSFNAMAITSLLQSSQLKNEYLDIAIKTLDQLLDQYYPSSRLYHTQNIQGFLEDYAYLGQTLITAYRLTNTPRYLILAETIAHQMIEQFYEYGFWKFSHNEFSVYDDTHDPLYPSAMSIAVLFLHQLSFLLDNDYNKFVFKTLEINSYKLMRQPLSSPTMSKVLLRYIEKML